MTAVFRNFFGPKKARKVYKSVATIRDAKDAAMGLDPEVSMKAMARFALKQRRKVRTLQARIRAVQKMLRTGRKTRSDKRVEVAA